VELVALRAASVLSCSQPRLVRSSLIAKRFDPVGALQVYQVVSQTPKSFCVALLPFLPQILAYQIEHCGEGAKAVVLLNVEL
jgi:hypothetical protein